MSQQDLVDRYGAPSAARRRLVLVSSIVVVVLFLAWLAWAAWAQATPKVVSGLVGWTAPNDHEVVATVDVKVKAGTQGAKCLVRASAEDHSVVGEAYFFVNQGGRFQQPIRTERRATSVELVGCTAPDQNRPH